MSEGLKRCPIACLQCGAASHNGTFTCDECKKPAPATANAPARTRYKLAAQMDDADRFLHTKEWERCSKTIRVYNPICQLIDDGVQCTSPSEEVHHLISPRVDQSKRTDPANLVAVCHACHHKGEGENPNDFREYAPTKAYGGVQHEHPKKPKLMEVRITAAGIAG
jgi:5-methylcytosine-specific restriction endonuclease McrA